MRLTLVTNMPTPYRGPLYARVRRLVEETGGSFRVIYGARWASDRQWTEREAAATGGVPSEFIRGQLRIGGKITYANPSVIRALARTQPDVVIVPGYAPWVFMAAAWCRARRVPYLLWTGETRDSAALEGTRRVRRLPLLRRAAGVLAYGPDAADYVTDLGVPAEQITIVGNGIEMDAFGREADALRSRRDEFRRDLGLHGKTILNVGAKGLDAVTAALPLLQTEEVSVLTMGTPEARDEGRVRHLGRRPASEMPSFYVASDCLAHTPLIDRWPHAVNEAFAAGLPVVAGGPTGVPRDVFTGPGCALVDRTDAHAVAQALDRALGVDAAADAAVRAAIAAPMRRWAVPQMAERLIAAATAAAR